MSGGHRTALSGAMLVAAVLCGVDLRAAPWRPASDAVVLEHVVPREQRRSTAAVDRGVDDTARLRAVRAAIERARATGDPRELGRAEALLHPPPRPGDGSIEWLVLQATIDQSLHRFDAALATLDVVLARDPAHVQALITRAAVLQVRGRLGAAARDCDALRPHVAPLVSAACAAGVIALQRRGPEAYALLDRELRAAALRGDAAPALLAWSHSVLAGIAERAGRVGDARTHYLAALVVDPDDPYVRAALADLLLDQGQPRPALALVANRRANDNLLLREALALQALGDPASSEAVSLLGQRYAAARLRGDALHLREEARFWQELRHAPARALGLASRNWQLQREPADARVLLETAVAAGDRRAETLARRWYAETGTVPADLSRRGRDTEPTRVARRQP
jgi:hypothetical protein